MALTETIAFIIHDLNERGGQDRLTLELCRRLARHKQLEIHSYTFESTSPIAAVHRRVRPFFARPVLLKSFMFHCVLTVRFFRRRSRENSIVHAAGSCAFFANVVQVHFVHRAWDRIERALPNRTGRSIFGAAYHLFLRKYDLWSESVAFRSDRTYLTVSQSVADEIRRYYPKIHRIETVYPGVDPACFRPAEVRDETIQTETRTSVGIAPGERVGLFVGTFDRKGLAHAIDAWGELRRRAVALPRLLIVGEGNPEAYRTRARALGVEDCLRFAGRRSDLDRLYRVADFLVFPTLYEPFGMVGLEAMASGVPPIVSRAAGCAELVEAGESGWLIDDPTDARELAEAVERAVIDPDETRRRGRNARLRALEQDWDRVAIRYEAALTRREAR